jgi:hypothetical protein
VTHVVSVSSSRRANRRFAHVRLEVPDLRKLGDAAPFRWSSYQFAREDDHIGYRQAIGAPVRKTALDESVVNWTGSELVAFRLHLPSNLVDQNWGSEAQHLRGNILVWEQTLADRRRGRPLVLMARMETKSILFSTLWLFGITFLAVGVTFALVVWWIMRRGAKPAHA